MSNISLFQLDNEFVLGVSRCRSLKDSADSQSGDGDLGSFAHGTRCIAAMEMLLTGLHVPRTGQDPEVMPPGGAR